MMQNKTNMPAAIPPHIVKCFKYIDAQKKKYVQELREIVAIPGISNDPQSYKELSSMIEWMEERLKGLGFHVDLKDVGNYTPEDSDSSVRTPFVLLGTLGRSGNAKTLLYYCHLDVADVARESSTTTDPFELIERDKILYGPGAAKMKGPLLCFLHALEAYKVQGLEIPVNIKIFCGIDCMLINDGEWISKKDPCLIHGSRGYCYFDVTIDGPRENFHSEEYGGILWEPIQDILFIINTLVDDKGRFKIPEFYDDVVQITPDEEDIYHNLRVNIDDYRKIAGLKKLALDGKAKRTLMNVWRNPSFVLHYIDNNLQAEVPVQLTIPKTVTARFSIRLVPYQNPERVCKLLYQYIEEKLVERCTPNNVTLKGNSQMSPWLEDHLHWNYEAARIATNDVYKQDPNLIRESRAYPTLLKFRKGLKGKKNILVLPLVDNESKIGMEGENISLSCYINSTKLLTSYLHHLSVVSQDS
ncbi:cytosolic non-specific dipeptidase-like isoform X2 [Venturia canescens]|uniref:cytosolic non-specific dipeptidase-like isoform X2 n=1 Tax=Venturia canescens TaxID=32260 RepID=UPI001C9D3AF7|nr:cytosolic non-specific dipeptidase-like isoform X2 [Venturia canescens]